MPKKNNSFFKKIISIIFLIINAVFAAGLLFGFLAQFIKPSWSIVIAYSGLLFPYLLYINLGFILFWVIFNYKFALLSILVTLFNINNIDRYYQMKEQEKPEKCVNCVKVMSYNTKLLGLYNSSSKKERNRQKGEIFALLRQERPDIVCFQEYFVDKSNTLNFHTTDSILSILKLEDNKKYYYQYLPFNLNHSYYYGLAIFSKYRIINADYVEMNDTSSNKVIYVDIKYKNDTLRVYNAHLSSMRMDEEDYEIGKQLINNNLDDPKFNKKAKILSEKINKAFINRQKQVIALRAHIDSCQYSIIICGDFNDSPISYSYHKISNGFKDTFRESGKGKGITYWGNSFPAYRIDYILHDKRFNSYGYTVCSNVKTSDHYPIYSYISILK
ncbi:MAG: endonuclease/exonuclease/phosphatase family protein [Bacteroidales bacterium]